MKFNLGNASGFTLIEIVVAIAILSVLSVYTAQSIQRAVKAKVKIEQEIDRTSVVREALRVMERDINLAFNYRDIAVELYNYAGQARQSQNPTPSPVVSINPTTGQPVLVTPSASAATPNAAQQAFKARQQKILTQFIGSEKELSFTTLSNVRTMADAPISDQAVVGYSVKDCANWIQKNARSQCLMRRLNPIITDDITKGGDETVLLENVTRFELRYLGPTREKEWLKDWATDGRGGDDVKKGQFPYAVEITIETQNKNRRGDKPVLMTWVAALRFPNNAKPSPGAAGGAAGALPKF